MSEADDPKARRARYQREYYLRNRETLLAKQRERGKRNYAESPETYRTRSKAWREANPDRYRELTKAHAERNREKLNARSRAWYLNNKERASAKARRAKLARYGLTEEDYQALLARQAGACAICRTEPEETRLYVDHCHRKAKVRGLLCQKCNSALGMLADDPALVKRALDYLASSGSSGATSTLSSVPPNWPSRKKV